MKDLSLASLLQADIWRLRRPLTQIICQFEGFLLPQNKQRRNSLPAFVFFDVFTHFRSQVFKLYISSSGRYWKLHQMLHVANRLYERHVKKDLTLFMLFILVVHVLIYSLCVSEMVRQFSNTRT